MLVFIYKKQFLLFYATMFIHISVLEYSRRSFSRALAYFGPAGLFKIQYQIQLGNGSL